MDVNTAFWIESLAMVGLFGVETGYGIFRLGAMNEAIKNQRTDIEQRVTKDEMGQIDKRLGVIQEDVRELRDWFRKNGKHE